MIAIVKILLSDMFMILHELFIIFMLNKILLRIFINIIYIIYKLKYIYK